MEHALQCAQFAEWAEAPGSLVAAALLHDIGHLLVPTGEPGRGDDNAHELRALGLLGTAFGREVLEPIRLHVQAKRYLAASDERYRASLSRASTLSLWRQGGPMAPAEVQTFEELPWAAQAVALRRWDDAALTRSKPTPSLTYYLDLLESIRRPVGEPRTALGPTDIC
jgi:predicted HD phosphohydrolase